MDKRTLPLVILLVVIIIFYYPILKFLGVYTPVEPPTDVDSTQVATDSIASETIPTRVPDLPQEPIREVSKPIASPAATEAIDSIPADTITILTNKYLVTLSSHGGGPVSLKLLDYFYRDGGEIEMLPGPAAATPDARFAGGTFSSSTLNYTCSLAPGDYDATRDTVHVDYLYQAPDGGVIRKQYYFMPDDYHFDLVVEVQDREQFGFERQYTLMWNTPLGPTEPQLERDYGAMQAVAMQSGSREALDDFEGNRLNQTLDGYTTWVGVRSQYFTGVMIPRQRDAELAVAQGEKRQVSTPDGRIEERRITAGLVMPFANVSAFSDSFTVYVGPMDYLLMSGYDVDLEAILDIGTMPFFGMIIKPFCIAIMWLLPKLYSAVPNYGVVIILFALLVKLITLPLSMKQFKSMQAMKELAPKMEELKKKHKKDPQALQRETMKLYKSHGVNPMSGCLVMLPQMPLMIAMFRVFQATILLRAAPFVGFVDDLSRGADGLTDPYIILVVLMVATQFISSKLTMASGQGQQKALLYIFPIMMGVLLYSLPSGLILYWTMFSVLSLLDWFLFKRNKVKNAEVKTA